MGIFKALGNILNAGGKALSNGVPLANDMAALEQNLEEEDVQVAQTVAEDENENDVAGPEVAEDSGWTSWFGHAGDDMSGAFLGGTGVGANTTNSIHIAMFVAGGVVILYVVMR